MHWNEEIENLLGSGYAQTVADGIRSLAALLDSDKALGADFDRVFDLYAVKKEIGIEEAERMLTNVAKEHGVNENGLHLMLVIHGLPCIHEAFRKKGLSDGVFYETMDDIRCKVNECVECRGTVGTFVLGWYGRFFDGTCFAFGRFQYEEAEFGFDDFTLSCGRVVKKGDRIINMHIPSRGIPLTDEIRLDSYRKAYRYFKKLFDDGIVIFCCSSWLLYQKHLEFLPENMNIRKFVKDFECVYSEETDDFHDRWRVFGRYASLPDEELPRDTALRKAYAQWLCSGHKTGYGFGLFAFDGERIVR